jgi:hypothetical protein
MSTTSKPSTSKKIVCRYYKTGKCELGEKCNFLHPKETTTQDKEIDNLINSLEKLNLETVEGWKMLTAWYKIEKNQEYIELRNKIIHSFEDGEKPFFLNDIVIFLKLGEFELQIFKNEIQSIHEKNENELIFYFFHRLIEVSINHLYALEKDTLKMEEFNKCLQDSGISIEKIVYEISKIELDEVTNLELKKKMNQLRNGIFRHKSFPLDSKSIEFNYLKKKYNSTLVKFESEEDIINQTNNFLKKNNIDFDFKTYLKKEYKEKVTGLKKISDTLFMVLELVKTRKRRFKNKLERIEMILKACPKLILFDEVLLKSNEGKFACRVLNGDDIEIQFFYPQALPEIGEIYDEMKKLLKEKYLK